MVPRYLSISDDAQTARKKKGVLFAEEPQQQSVEMTSLQVGRSRLVCSNCFPSRLQIVLDTVNNHVMIRLTQQQWSNDYYTNKACLQASLLSFFYGDPKVY
jgi:hypothetical protein